MPTRTRLFASFVCVALLLLTLFGALAYRIAADAAVRQDALILQRSLDAVAADLAPRLQTPDYRPEQLPAQLPEQLKELRLPTLQHARLLVIHDNNGDLLPLGNLQRDRFAGRQQLLDQLRDSLGPRAGQLDVAGQSFTWASVFIPGTQLRLTLVHPTQVVGILYQPSLITGLLLLTLLAVVIALWGARGLNALLHRHQLSQNARLVHQALHDELTDLPNRTLLYDRLDQELHHAHRDNRPLALFLMDLDRFKEVNDTLGHHFGDYLLQQVSHRVRDSLRETDTVARLGGDEFAVLLPDTDADAAIQCAEKLIAALDAAIPVSGMSLSIKSSLGIALYPQHGHDAETLLQHADVAMYAAKQHADSYRVYEQDEDPNSVRRLTLVSELRNAILTDQLVLHYQPKVNLRQQRTVGVEALVRWQHPKLGLLAPEEFIPIAEQNGLIGILTDWVLNAAAKQCQEWRDRGINLRVAVNLSAHSLHNLRLPDHIAGILESARLPPRHIDIELTESAMMSDLMRANDIFERLAQMGIRLAIDDFGTGMSSLSYLKRLPVNELKIDKSFVTDMADDENNAVIVRSIIDLAHNIGREVVAEGVENKDVLQLLEMLGCDTAQGFFISPPLAPAALETWLHDSPWSLRRGQAAVTQIR